MNLQMWSAERNDDGIKKSNSWKNLLLNDCLQQNK